MLKYRKRSAWEQTMADAMVKWKLADDLGHAYELIDLRPGEDLAGIDSAVQTGLTSLETTMFLPEGSLFTEQLEGLSKVTELDIIEAIDAIHLNWREENWKRFLEKCVLGEEQQYRQTQRIGWEEALKDLLFIRRYLMVAGVHLDELALEKTFEQWASETANDNMDFEEISEALLSNASENVFNLTRFKLRLCGRMATASQNNDQEEMNKIRLQLGKVDEYLRSMPNTSNESAICLMETKLLELGWM